jgi:5'-methylthioadenosine phosphorylase
MSDTPAGPIAIIGGSGLYELLDNPRVETVTTPYGDPSSPLHHGDIAGRPVVFLPRHGPDHLYPAHMVNYRANLWALKEVGASAILAPCSAGSLQPHIEPGHYVVLDQFVDRTSGRRDTFFDGPGAQHTSMADPYDTRLGAALAAAGRAEGLTVHEGGTVVVISGPRFSTRAESRWFSQMGWHVVNMTQYPEAPLANELGIPFGGVALVTDYDAGVVGRDDIEPVTMEQVFAFFKANIASVRGVLARTVASL